MKTTVLRVLILTAAVVSVIACSSHRKVAKIEKSAAKVSLSLPNDILSKIPNFDSLDTQRPDTIMVTDENGETSLLMKATKDESGETVASDVITAAVITARFRNVAERHGKITIEFQIKVPKEMQDTKWQLRFYPDLVLMDDTTHLDKVIITGEEYRKAQIRGYQQYDRFLARIINDSTRFIDLHNLELFIQRNIPQLYAFKTDSSFVSDEQFATVFGVTEREAVDHYTNKYAIKMNDRLKGKRAKMYAKYVKSPFLTEGIRLDTVIYSFDGDFLYTYVQSFETRPKLRKAEVFLQGEIFQQEQLIYSIPRSEPLTYYISSLSAFVDASPRYKTKVIERKAEANTACRIDFAVGKSNIDLTLGVNALEISRIKGNLRSLLENKTYDLDSIVISASASPEGSLAANNALSLQRAKSASTYFDSFLKHTQDSLKREAGMSITVGDDMSQGSMKSAANLQSIRFISRSGGENWEALDELVRVDSTISKEGKRQYYAMAHVKNLDEREKKLREREFYPYMLKNLYPKLRIVRFDFHLHRKGMIKDTVHTTELDSVYMAGIQAIRDRDYKVAVDILRPYNDYNLAVAYCSLDYNQSALSILEKLPEKTAQVNYMLAVIYSRQGKDQKAVQCYLNSCNQNPSYVHRGNLDPEISALIKRYGLTERLQKQVEQTEEEY